MRLTARGAGMEATRPTPLTEVRFGRLRFLTGTRQAAFSRICEWTDNRNRSGHMLGFINPHVYNNAVAEPAVAEFLDECDYVCVDGVGVTVAARLLHRLALPRVVATDLLDDFVGLDRPLNILLVGTTTAEVIAAADKINARAPAIRVLEAVDGFRDFADYESLLERHQRIDAVLVGAGSPKSEQILLRARELCPAALLFHIGAGTIKLYADTKRKAPGLLSRLGLEWAHRIVFEPHTRSRYFSGAWKFVSDVVRSRSAT